MKARKIMVSIICIVLVVLFILSISVMVIVPALAASSDDIKSEIDGLKSEKSEIQGRIDALQVQIDDLDYQKQSTLEKKAMLDEKNTLAQEELDIIEEQIEIINNYMANRQVDLVNARKQEEYISERATTRLRALEEGERTDFLSVLMQAKTFTGLLTSLDAIEEITENDDELFDNYINARKNVEALEAEAEEMAKQNEANLQELEEKKAQLEADIDAANAMIIELESTLEGYEELRAAEEADANALAAQISAKQAEYDEAVAREQAIAAAQAGAAGSSIVANFDGDGSTFLWPSYTSLITSYFGYRESPGGIGSTNHKGVDIGAAYGTAIWASADGYVTQAGWNSGYGNCVTISHGNGYTTLYAHMSSVAVSAGQYVAQGQVIGYCGSTGNSTGPHIHYSILVNGSFVNPLAFNFIYA